MTASELTEKVGAIDSELAAIKSDIASIKTSVPTAVDDITRLKLRLDELLKAAEEAQRKADSEAHRAYLAKEICEQHAKATTDQRGMAEAATSAINGFKTSADEYLRGISAAKTQAEDSAKVVNDAKDAAAKAQETLSKIQPQLELEAKAIQDQRTTGDEILEELRKHLLAAKTGSGEIESQKNSSITHSDAIGKSKNATDDLLKKSEENLNEIRRSNEEAEKSKKSITQLVEDLGKRNDEIVKFKADLAKMTADYKSLYEAVDGLLPHAASASLASAFRTQKKRFFIPQILWLFLFIASVLCLVVIAVPDTGWAKIGAAFGHQVSVVPIETATKTEKWDDILLQTVRRLPLIIPLAWLAVFAGRNFSLATRLEEDYAFKEAVSTAFEGYKREMKEMKDAGGEKGSPLNTLCNNVLNAIAQRPGRIYDGKHQDVTPLTPVSNAIRDIRDREVA